MAQEIDPALDTGNLNTLEQRKFTTNSSDEVVVRTTAVGTFTPTGLTTAIKITTMIIGDTETLLPTSALTGRNSFGIQNKSTTDTLYVGPTGVTADTVVGTTSGWEIDPTSILPMDITNNIPLYGIAPAGKTITVKIMELA